jgi:D-methionine transport system ATP-binding protein
VVDVFTRPREAITKSLIDEIVPQELPASVLTRVRRLAQQLAPGHSGQLLRLAYAGEQAYEPILSHLIRELGLDLSILHGQIDEIQEQTFGSLAVYTSGPMARIGAAIDYLRAQGVVVRTVDVQD